MRFSSLFAAAVVTLVSALPSLAQDTIVTPGDAIPPVATSPPFGAVVPGGVATTQYTHLGLALSDRGAAGPSVQTAIFNDPPLAFAGVNGGGNVDLVSAVDGRLVVLNTTNQGLTNLVQVVAGNADANTLTLHVYDITGAEISSALNVNGGADLFGVSTAGFTIASFRVEGGDSFGVREIRFNTPIAAGGAAAPEPGSLLLFAPGLLLFARRRR